MSPSGPPVHLIDCVSPPAPDVRGLCRDEAAHPLRTTSTPSVSEARAVLRRRSHYFRRLVSRSNRLHPPSTPRNSCVSAIISGPMSLLGKRGMETVGMDAPVSKAQCSPTDTTSKKQSLRPSLPSSESSSLLAPLTPSPSLGRSHDCSDTALRFHHRPSAACRWFSLCVNFHKKTRAS